MKYKKKIPLLICIAGLLSFILIFSFSFKIEQAGATELEVPTINVIPDIYNTDEILYIEGRAEPNSVVEIRFQRQGSKPVTFIIRADPGGEWVFAQRVDFSSGEYEVRARTRDGERASQWSNPRIFKTKVTGIVIGRVLGKFSLLSLTIFLLLLAGAGMALYFHLRVKRTKEESRQRFYEQKKELTLLEVEKDFVFGLRLEPSGTWKFIKNPISGLRNLEMFLIWTASELSARKTGRMK